MATRKELEQALSNPNVRKMLDLIAASEGVKHGYNTIFGNERFNNLNQHPNVLKGFTQTNGVKNGTTAAGRYQFLNKTWNNLQKQYGFNDFGANNQDLGAIALIAGRGALADVQRGDYKAAIGKLGKEWASLPSSTYAQGKRSWDFVSKQLGRPISSQEYQPQMVNLSSVGISQPKQAQQQAYKPQMVDLKSVGISGSQPQQQSAYSPQLVDLKSVGIG